MSETLTIITEWNQHAATLKKAVENRSYTIFKSSFKKGCQCFNRLKEFIEKGNVEELKAHRAEVEETVANWQTIADMLPKWMEELKSDIEKKRKKFSNDKKIGNAYRFMKKTGTNLRVKAR